ncbi:Trimeric GatFAB AmidoTransferase(AdT) complex subunit [Haplosporangium sp. Z 27]|nr:Trimeric GatFAB AmidoTransferase(AdT) complex subunit [Haplosporangium sp. Z 27]
MKRSSSSGLPAPKFRKQAPVDDYKPTGKTAGSQPKSASAGSEPKSILKKPLRSESSENSSSKSSSKPKGSISGASILKANTAANKASLKSSSFGAGSKGGKPKAVAIRASRGDVTGGMGRKKRKASTNEINSGDDSDSDNDGEDERDSDDDEEEDEEDDEDDIEGIAAKTTTSKKSSKKHSEESMAEAMSKILGSTLRKADANTPILARSRGAERKIEEEKLEAKARRAITNERKRLANRDRVKPEYTGMEYEKKLRKVATRGVVQLFNAIKAQQKATEELTDNVRPITTNAKDKVASLTKASFLDLLKSGTKVSTSYTPVSAATEALENISKYNKYVNAYIDVADPESIRDQAKESARRWETGETRSPIDGAVFGYKMNLCTKELRTTCASKMLDNFKSPYTATAIELLQEAGAITGGKLNMDEFGMGSHNVFSNTGPVKNPHGILSHDPESLDDLVGRSAGGSSGGSAAAVASKMCFAALGSDTGGSVRLPASYCGVVGFKPSYGRISRWGLVAYGSSLDTVGILSRTVDDAKTIFDIIAKEDEKDSTCLTKRQRDVIAKSLKDFSEQEDKLLKINNHSDSRPLSKVRVGIPQEFNIAELSPATKELWKQGIKTLKDAGAKVVPVSIPNTHLAVGAYLTLATAEASSNLQRFDGIRYGYQSDIPDKEDALYTHTRNEGFGKEVRRRILLGTYVLTSGSFDNFFLRAQKIRQMIRNDFDKVFAQPNGVTGSFAPISDRIHDDRVHVLLTPVAVETAPKLEDVIGEHIDPINAYLDDILTIPASLAGLPAMSVPFGKGMSDGFPVGLQVISQYGDEEMVFKVGRVLEEGRKS